MVRIGVKVRRQATTTQQQNKCHFLAVSRLIWLIASLTLSIVLSSGGILVRGQQRFQTPTERILNRRLANIREVEWNAPKVLPPVAKNPAVFPELTSLSITKSPKRLFPPLVSKVTAVSHITRFTKRHFVRHKNTQTIHPDVMIQKFSRISNMIVSVWLRQRPQNGGHFSF